LPIELMPLDDVSPRHQAQAPSLTAKMEHLQSQSALTAEVAP
jgi:hypothetical protein